jgi:hypothetical protein
MSLSTNYWCRVHGRYEHTEDDEACRTYDEVMAEFGLPWRRDDPPSLMTKIKQFFGIKVLP